MSKLTRYWIIGVHVPDGAFESYPSAHIHTEAFGASANAFWRLHEIREMMDEGVIPTMRVTMVSEPLRRVA